MRLHPSPTLWARGETCRRPAMLRAAHRVGAPMTRLRVNRQGRRVDGAMRLRTMHSTNSESAARS